ncbi:MAG: glycosyltransferase family 4 protein [Candidatus Binatia bacterium]
MRIFVKECIALARAGYDVTLLAQHGHDEAIDGVTVRTHPQAKNRFGRVLRSTWHVYSQARRLNASVYHFHDPELIPVGLLLGCGGKRVVYDIHEDVPETVLSKYYLPRWFRRPVARLVEAVECSAARWFSALVPATPAIARRFAPYNNKVTMVQNFPRLEELSVTSGKEWQQREPAVAYVGGIAPERGIYEMVDAIHRVPATLRPRLKLGGTFNPVTVRDQVVRLPGWTRVEELGWIDRPQVCDVLGKVQAGLILLRPEPRFQVSYPVKMFEYMAAGIPVIASNFPLWRQIIEDARCGLLVDPLEPSTLADAITYIMTHPQEAEAMGRRGKEAVVQRYNWAREEQKLLALYEDLMPSSPTFSVSCQPVTRGDGVAVSSGSHDRHCDVR